VDTTHAALDLVRERSPERPVALVRPDAVAVAARWFQDNFRGHVLYAVKANPSLWALDAMTAAGINRFDVASLDECRLIHGRYPHADLAFMHPIKSPSSITRAYHDYGVRTFALDTHEELEKICAATGGGRDLNLIVRIAVSADGANLPLTGKFGVSLEQAPDLLLAARRATDERMGISFHVGSQCMRPTAYRAAMAQANRAIVRAGVVVDVVDVGGGFPSVYPGMTPPPLGDYMQAIEGGFADMSVSEACELWCEPGRAMVAEATSILTRVEMRKGDALYLNDGSYGALFDATHAKWRFPTRLVRPEGQASETLRPFRFYGPTCDSMDQMPGPFWLPEDVKSGDYVDIGMLGAYGVAMATRFNGYGDIELVESAEAPMSSMFGLAPAHIALPRTAEAPVVIKFIRTKGRRRRK